NFLAFDGQKIEAPNSYLVLYETTKKF
ncbi:hypothetical protein SAMN05421823_1331, partial [Catalinimonas alkaloidigena]